MPKCQSLPTHLDARTHLLSALEASPDLPRLKQMLTRAILTGLWRNSFVSARFIASIAAYDLSFAQLAFSAAYRPSAFSYNTMIRAHSAGATPSLSLHLFTLMLRSGLYPDRFTFPFLFRASSRADRSPARVTALHALAVRRGLAHDPHVATSLLHSYASSGLAYAALKAFDETTERTTVSWNAIISCCARSTCHHQNGLFLLADMLSSGVHHADANTFVAAFSCCAGHGALALGRSVHAAAARQVVGPTVEMVTALVHMYAELGSLETARLAFESMEARDASTWTAMIGGLAMHGRGKEAVALFERMGVEGVAPDSVTFTCLLHACSHSGLVDEGLRVFKEMTEVYKVEARMQHYGAMVDLLWRNGRLEEAERIVEAMPFEPNRVVWGSLLHCCLVRGDDRLGLGEGLERRFLGLGLEGESGFYVGVSNEYARVGKWEEVGRVRGRMAEKGVRKERGFSLVEVDGRVNKFLVADTGHPLTMEIHSLLCGIKREMMNV